MNRPKARHKKKTEKQHTLRLFVAAFLAVALVCAYFGSTLAGSNALFSSAPEDNDLTPPKTEPSPSPSSAMPSGTETPAQTQEPLPTFSETHDAQGSLPAISATPTAEVSSSPEPSPSAPPLPTQTANGPDEEIVSSSSPEASSGLIEAPLPAETPEAAADNATQPAPRALLTTIKATQLVPPSPTSVQITGTIGLTGLLASSVKLTYSTKADFSNGTVISLTAGNGVTDGTFAIGVYTKLLTGLTPNTLYYIKVEATTLSLLSESANTNFTTIPTAPMVSRLVPSSSDGTKATMDAAFSGNGPAAFTGVKVIYSLTGDLLLPTTVTVSPGTGTGQYTSAGFSGLSIPGLSRGIRYYFQVQLSNAGGTAVSAVQQFTAVSTTMSVTVPTSLLFSAFQSSAGNVQSPVFTMRNNSDYSVKVQLQSVSVTSPDSIRFTSAPTNSGELRLDIAGETGTGFQGFSMTGVDTSGTSLGSAGNMGTLGGTILSTSTTPEGKFHFAGKYVGGFYTATTYKQPKLSFSFKLTPLYS